MSSHFPYLYLYEIREGSSLLLLVLEFLPSGFGGRVGCDGNTSDILPRVVLTATALVGGGSGGGGSRAGAGVPGASVPSAHHHCLVGGGGGARSASRLLKQNL